MRAHRALPDSAEHPGNSTLIAVRMANLGKWTGIAAFGGTVAVAATCFGARSLFAEDQAHGVVVRPQASVYSCRVHTQVRGFTPGICPQCGRTLRQHEHPGAPGGQEMHGEHDHAMNGLYGPYPYPLSRESSGTSWQPDSASHGAIHWSANDWTFMLHGFAQGLEGMIITRALIGSCQPNVPSSRRWPSQSRPANLPERNGLPRL